jgi:hypothetical protein
MRRSSIGLLALLLATLGGAPAQATTILSATLTNVQENPPTVPTTSAGAPRANAALKGLFGVFPSSR